MQRDARQLKMSSSAMFMAISGVVFVGVVLAVVYVMRNTMTPEREPPPPPNEVVPDSPRPDGAFRITKDRDLEVVSATGRFAHPEHELGTTRVRPRCQSALVLSAQARA